MAKGAFITDEVRRVIARVYNENPEAHAKEIQPEVSRRLNGNGTWPSQSVVEHELVKIRARHFENQKNSDSIEAQWHMGTLDKYPVTPDVIPDILAVKQWGEKNLDSFKQPYKPLTIRQARWIARLYGIACLFRNPLNKKKNKKLDIQAWLWHWSEAYAQYEIICELSQTSFDTSKLDNHMWQGDHPVSAKNAVVFLSNDNKIDYVGDIPTSKDGE